MKYKNNVNCTPMSFNDKQIPSPSDGTAPMSFSKKSGMGGESRPPAYRPESVMGKNK